MGHFPSYDMIRASFLRHFRVEKTIGQTLECLQVLKQGKRPAEEYAAKFRVLVQRVLVGQRPAQEVINAYFCKGLIKDFRTALTTMDKVNNTLENVIVQALLAGESLEDVTTPPPSIDLKGRVAGPIPKHTAATVRRRIPTLRAQPVPRRMGEVKTQ